MPASLIIDHVCVTKTCPSTDLKYTFHDRENHGKIDEITRLPARSSMNMRIDSHHHLWDREREEFDYSWQETDKLQKICRSFLPGDLEPLIKPAGVRGTVVVQTQHNLQENRWALQLAEAHDWILGVVGWVDLASPQCEAQLLEFKDHPKFVGVRHVTQDEPDPDFIIRDDISRGLSVLENHQVPFDLLFYLKHLKHTETVARRFPGLPLVIDHLGKPDIQSGQIEPWKSDLSRAAQHPNVHCKLSGLITEADWESWSIDDLRPYVEAAIELFGAERCMFGSDWPVCQLAGSYQQVLDSLQTCIAGLSEPDRQQVMSKTAVDFYQLKTE
ncbi:MAG: amidohydrolase family protein [Mariniblastus sp.]|nr:amidohydrolase family protein [Mariniblastus sp.]